MKFNITIDINDYEDMYDIQDAIIDEAADKFLQQVFGDWDEKNSFKSLEKRIVEKMGKILDSDFKMSVSTEVTKRLSDKFERTQQYKTLKNGLEIENEQMIKTGLKGLVADIVKSEMKNMFK